MAGFREVMNELARRRDAPDVGSAGTSNRCGANGCPNAASVNGKLCYHHHATQPDEWAGVTTKIRQTWPAMRNFNVPGAVYERSLAAKEFDAAQKRRRGEA